jgi:hypothetical protein
MTSPDHRVGDDFISRERTGGSEMKISEMGPACVFGDDHPSDVDTRIGQWFAVAGGVIALWGFGNLLLKR